MVTITDFKRWAKAHPNFMTPHIVKVKKSGNYFIELSEGRGFDSYPMYGVSLIFWNGTDFTTSHDRDEDKSVFTGKDAEFKAIAHFNGLR